jgi:hypothetical protein
MKRRKIHINKDECKEDPTLIPIRELRDVFTQIKVNIKTEAEIPVIAARKDFVRWRVGNMTLPEVITRRKQEGRNNWYV